MTRITTDRSLSVNARIVQFLESLPDVPDKKKPLAPDAPIEKKPLTSDDASPPKQAD